MKFKLLFNYSKGLGIDKVFHFALVTLSFAKLNTNFSPSMPVISNVGWTLDSYRVIPILESHWRTIKYLWALVLYHRDSRVAPLIDGSTRIPLSLIDQTC